jgi:hypothetical protein
MAGGKKKSKNARRKKDRIEAPPDKVAGQAPPNVVVEEPERTPPEPEPEPEHAPRPEVDAGAATPVARARLSEMVPVRFEAQMLADVKQRAAEEHRSVSGWIRVAVDHELQQAR